jgi:hypothetical protein
MKTKHTTWLLALLIVGLLASCTPYATVGVNYGPGYRPYRPAPYYGYNRYRRPIIVAPAPRAYRYNYRPYNNRPYNNPVNPRGRTGYDNGGNRSRGPR